VPWPSCGNVKGQVLGEHGLAVTGLAVHGAGLAMPEQVVHKPLFAAVCCELAEQEKAALAIELYHLVVELCVVCGANVHHIGTLERFRLRSS
jgi:hypothetical protein